MDKLSELLKVLKDNNLNKTYDRVMTDIADIKSALSVVNEEVNDIILSFLSDGKYEEVNKLTSIPAMSSNVVIQIDILLNGNIIESKSNEIKEENIEKIQKEDTLQYSGIITSIKGLKKGAKVVHKSFGIGKVISLEQSQDSENKILKVNFDSCGEKPFNCSAEILEKYFDISINEEESKRVYNSEIDGNLKILFDKVEEIIYSVNSKIEKGVTNVYYKYTLDGKVICTINCKPRRINIFFNIPIGNMVDNDNLLVDVSNKGHLGVGDYKLAVTRDMNIDGLYTENIKSYIEQIIKYHNL